MKVTKERLAIEDALDKYRAQLDLISDEQFTETPPGGGWSYAEVYSHILQATLGSTIALERCTHDNCKPTSKKLNVLGNMVMLLGRFPVKVKVPPKTDDKMPALKISKEEAKNLLVKCRKRIEVTSPLIEDSLPGSRHKHPRLGMLNAKQWFKFIRIHLVHHLKQLNRIEKKMNDA